MLYVSQETVTNKKQNLDEIWMPDDVEIKTIPETRKNLFFFEKVSQYVIKSSLVSDDMESYKTFNFISGTSENEDLVSGEEVSFYTNQSFNVGEWVLVPFEGKKLIKHFAGLIIAKQGSSTLMIKFL